MSETTSLPRIDSFRGKHRWLSNFHEAPIRYLDLEFKTTEAAYQAAKRIGDTEFHKHIASLATPKEAMFYGRSLEITTPNWHKFTKYVVMWDVNWLKYTGHEDLKKKLIDTGDAELVEGNTWGDTVWGECNGVGNNALGKTLMNIRNLLVLS